MGTRPRALCVTDGAKAFGAGIKKVFGGPAQVQRCVLHKRRNLEEQNHPEFLGVGLLELSYS
jgi:transposase-like protein